MPIAPLLRFVSVVAAVATIAAAADDAAVADDAVPVVIITGEDIPVHDWKTTGPALQRELQTDARLKVDLVEDVSFVRSPKLHDYRVVVLHFRNARPDVPGREAFDNLRRFVEEGGGGLVLVHFACGAFHEFKPDMERLVGRTWIGLPAPPGRHQHDPYGPFRVDVVDAKHPICAGLQAFDTRDELYTCLEGTTPVGTLAEAVSTIEKRAHPQALVKHSGRGRVFLCTLGHDLAAISNPGTAELYRRGTAWTAGLTPAAGLHEEKK